MKRKDRPADPYRDVVEEFNRKGVRYVVVGMSGINYYAKSPAGIFGTLDYDIFLEPTLTNIKKAVQALDKLDFSLSGPEGVLKGEDLRELVRNKQTLIATTPYGVMVELLLEISGYSYAVLAKDAAIFSADNVPIRVGRLSKLLRSKKLAARPKDLNFLKRYGPFLEEEEKRNS